MIIKPRVRGFMCTTAHPAGCEASVSEQINYVRSKGKISGPQNVLVLGASTGYGLASRICAAMGASAATLGVFFEKEGSDKRTASAGWYNSAAFHKFADEAGLKAVSINGDAFSNECKQRTIDLLKTDFGPVDLVIYSLAAPRRVHPITGNLHKSTLKPIGTSVEEKTLDTDKCEVKQLGLDAATNDEIADTIAVMGGEDWGMWIDALADAGVLAEDCKTTAYTYLGDKITWSIYWDGTIGAAKKDLDKTVVRLRERLAAVHGDARVSVLKAVVTQASSAIPIMPLYLSLLFKVMKEKGVHEGCIEQIDGLFRECLYGRVPQLDGEGRLRMDAKELQPEIQQEVERLWPLVNNGNIDELTDFAGYQEEFLKLFGFGFEGVDYQSDIDAVVEIPGLITI